MTWTAGKRAAPTSCPRVAYDIKDCVMVPKVMFTWDSYLKGSTCYSPVQCPVLGQGICNGLRSSEEIVGQSCADEVTIFQSQNRF